MAKEVAAGTAISHAADRSEHILGTLFLLTLRTERMGEVVTIMINAKAKATIID